MDMNSFTKSFPLRSADGGAWHHTFYMISYCIIQWHAIVYHITRPKHIEDKIIREKAVGEHQPKV